MAISRTARGTASSKTNGANLTIPSFTVPEGHCLVVSAGYDNALGAPTSVIHAGKLLRRKTQRDDATNGFHASMWIKGEYRKAQTGTCILTWSGSIGKRCAAAQSFDFVCVKNDNTNNLNASSAAPNTGLGATLQNADELVVANFVSEGPGSDHSGHTADILDGGTFASAGIGQQVGTAGAPPISNITLIETWMELSSTQATRARLQSATSRNWISQFITLIPRHEFWRQGITPHDIETVEDLIETAGGNPHDASFDFNEDTGLWEAWEDATQGTLRATRDINGVWSAP